MVYKQKYIQFCLYIIKYLNLYVIIIISYIISIMSFKNADNSLTHLNKIKQVSFADNNSTKNIGVDYWNEQDDKFYNYTKFLLNSKTPSQLTIETFNKQKSFISAILYCDKEHVNKQLCSKL